MSRIAPALLVCLLAYGSPARADDTYPPLDQRLGKTITVVEKNQPTEKAVITQVWRLDDGTPVMQARTVTSNTQMTLVENLAAKTVTERIKVIRWTNGVRPEGCPVPPVAAAKAAVKTQAPASTQNVAKTQAPAKTQPAVTQTQYTRAVKETPVADKSGPVVTTEGGLLPVLPKKEVAQAAPKMMAPPAVTVPPVPVTNKPVKTEVVTMPSVKSEVKNLPLAPATTVVTKQASPAPAVITTAPMQAATQAVPASKPELIGGCEVITVTENGVARKYNVLGTARDKHGVMTHRCQALDNNEIVTLNCDSCKTCAAPAASKPVCPPVACAPAPVKCEPAKVACAPAPVKVETKPCEPVKAAPCEPAKVACAPAKACDPCANKACDDKKCDPCATKGGLHCKKESLFDRSCRRVRCSSCAEINVPVPGVRLATVNGAPAGPPPQPMIPAFCTMNSSSVRAYMCAPQLVSSVCLHRPFGDCLNNQIMAGMYQANGANGEAVANTLYLMNVLAQSSQWENRKWAAERLQQATVPTVKPYVEDALMAAVHSDRAPLVKVAAIRTLASMQSTRHDVMAMLSMAAADADPRIREAAGDAMQSISKTMQQAGYSSR